MQMKEAINLAVLIMIIIQKQQLVFSLFGVC